MIRKKRKIGYLWLVGFVAAGIALTGCATPKTVSIDSDPSGARIHIGAEYLGDAPLNIPLDEAGALSSDKFFTIKATKRGYMGSSKVINTKHIPNRILFELEKEPSASTASGGGQQQQMQQQMQGPTIVIPGSGGQPIQITPGGTK